jgi:hypothetical protein
VQRPVLHIERVRRVKRAPSLGHVAPHSAGELRKRFRAALLRPRAKVREFGETGLSPQEELERDF